MISFDVKSRWTGEVKFTASIKCDESASYGIKLGLAVKWALETRANLTGADMTRANLTDANLTDANLTGADMTRANLTDANLTGADMTRANLTDANLTRANLTRADMTDANLTGADMTRANLTDANLTGADMTRANLTDANLTDANLTGADMTRANLTDANLTGADMTRANLTGADMTRANLTDAALRAIRADFFDVLLRALPEVVELLRALRAGKINGSTYTGDCACLAGTIANARHVQVENLGFADSSRPAERWFLAIQEGDSPENSGVAKITEDWILEFMSLVGINDAEAEAS